jgi:hypothetical protein
MVEICRPTFAGEPVDLETRLSELRDCLRSLKPTVGVELSEELKAMVREAHGKIAMQALKFAQRPNPLEVLQELQIWRCLEVRTTSPHLSAGAAAQNLDMILQLLDVVPAPLQTATSKAGRTRDDRMDAAKERISELRSLDASTKEICRQLDLQRFPTPRRSAWSGLTWSKAYQLHSGSVKTWISKYAKT